MDAEGPRQIDQMRGVRSTANSKIKDDIVAGMFAFTAQPIARLRNAARGRKRATPFGTKDMRVLRRIEGTSSRLASGQALLLDG